MSLSTRSRPSACGIACRTGRSSASGRSSARRSRSTFTLHEDHLEFFGISEARLAGAVALVKRHLGSGAGRPSQRMRSIEQAVSATRNELGAKSASANAHRGRSARGRDEGPAIPDARIRDLTSRRWIDDPDPRLSGMSPRDAATHDGYRDEFERALRSFQHHSARERDDALPGPGVAWLRVELGLDDSTQAA